MTPPIVKAQMLIRKPVAEVFNAFVDPLVTTRFWFTKSSGRLEAGARVRWDWEMYGVSDEVDVKAIEPNARIVFEWSFPNSNLVEMRFAASAKATMVSIANTGLRGDDVAALALDLAQGWNIVLCAAKAWLEHGIELNAIADKAPDHNVKGWGQRMGSMNKPNFVYVIYIQAPKTKVWTALTSGEHTKHFWTRYVQSQWTQGARVEFLTADKSKLSHDGEVLEIDPPNRLVMTFDLTAEGVEEAPSRVTYDLSETDGVTKLTVVHDDFPPNSDVLHRISGGWPRILSNMKTYIESGEIENNA